MQTSKIYLSTFSGLPTLKNFLDSEGRAYVENRLKTSPLSDRINEVLNYPTFNEQEANEGNEYPFPIPPNYVDYSRALKTLLFFEQGKFIYSFNLPPYNSPTYNPNEVEEVSNPKTLENKKKPLLKRRQKQQGSTQGSKCKGDIERR